MNHFAATPADFVLPGVGSEAGRTPFAQLADAGSVIGMLSPTQSSVISYATLDMDGDSKPDLVMTERNAMPGVGTSKWLVFRNTGTGFTAPIDFVLPGVGAEASRTPFAQIANAESVIGMLTPSQLSIIAYALVDMDGDRKPDLVMTERNAMPGVGTTKWLVFPNTGTGFTAPVEFALPAVGAEASRTPFAQIGSAESVIGMLPGGNQLSVIAYALLDFDGDRKPDLVITERNAMPGVGSSKWLLYKNLGTGFAPTPVEIVLPGVGAEASRVPFAQIANSESVIGMLSPSQLSVIAYTTTDLDADGKPDLVITERNAVPGVGTTKWQMFPNTGAGFGAPIDFGLPAVGAEASRVPFAQIANFESVIGMSGSQLNVIAYTTTDLDGDRKADLVMTERTTIPGVGTTKWQVFPNIGTGFGPAVDFALPAVGAEPTRVPFAQIANAESVIGTLSSSQPSVIAYSTTDLDGDGKVDLVLTERNKETGVGVSRWQVFAGACTENP